MKLEDLTEEQIKQARACKTAEERLAFIREYEIELADEQLEAISGGAVDFEEIICGKC